MPTKSVVKSFEILRKSTFSFWESLLASESIGLSKKMISAAIKTLEEITDVWFRQIIYFIKHNENESSNVEQIKQGQGFFRWKPPLNFLIIIKGIINIRDSTNILKITPKIMEMKIGVRPNKRL